jgi:hypothetical protein
MNKTPRGVEKERRDLIHAIFLPEKLVIIWQKANARARRTSCMERAIPLKKAH